MPKKSLADYGAEEEKSEPVADESSEESEGSEGMMELAEATGVEDPMALLKLIKRVCMTMAE